MESKITTDALWHKDLPEEEESIYEYNAEHGYKLVSYFNFFFGIINIWTGVLGYLLFVWYPGQMSASTWYPGRRPNSVWWQF